MIDDLGHLAAVAAPAVAVIGALGAAWLRFGRPRWRTFFDKLDQGLTSVAGRPEIRDPATGRVLAPAVPGIGVRMANVEDAVTLLVANQKRLDDHDARIGKLEQAAIERIVNRADSALGWAAVVAASGADVPDAVGDASLEATDEGETP